MLAAYYLLAMAVTPAMAAEFEPEKRQQIWSELPNLPVRLVPAGESTTDLMFAAERLDDGERIGSLRLTTVAPAGVRATTARWAFQIEQWNLVEADLRALVVSANVLAEIDGGWKSRQAARSPSFVLFGWGAAVLVALAAFVAAFRVPVVYSVRLLHGLPVLVQGSVFAYWACYWPPVIDQMGSIFGQLLLAYAVDGLLSVWRRRKWVLGLGTIPIVLSINLFFWLDTSAALVAVAVAIGSKVFLTRNDRHIFNPSALALCAVGVAAWLSPDVHYRELFHTMNLPPFIGEWILVAALVPQLRLPIVLVSLGAVVGSDMASRIGPGPGLFRPPTILAIALLLTDPATIPRSQVGRFLHGFGYGVLLRLTSMVLISLGQTDELAKVLPIPMLNALAPQMDAFAGRFEGLRAFDVRYNRAHVAVWFLLAALVFWMVKPRQFDGAWHWTYRTAGVSFGPDGVPTCEENPGFCRGFGVAQPEKLGDWLRLRAAGPD